MTKSEAEVAKEQKERGLWWSEYASKYDEFVVPLTCYQDNIRQLLDFIEHSDIPESASVCDLGAGTGIYIEAMSNMLPEATFRHLDSNVEMCRYAQQRYSEKNLPVEILNTSANDTGFQPETLDLVTSINVIYALPNPIQTLKDIFSWLTPGGYFFTIDFGRRQNSLDWTQYFFRELFKREGAVNTMRAIPAALNLFKRQNEGAAAQDAGNYWIHSTEEFEQTLQAVGFQVEESRACYRGYADLAICRKP